MTKATRSTLGSTQTGSPGANNEDGTPADDHMVDPSPSWDETLDKLADGSSEAPQADLPPTRIETIDKLDDGSSEAPAADAGPTSIIRPDGTTITDDPNGGSHPTGPGGNVISTTDPQGIVTNYGPDGAITSSIDNAGNTTTYDPNGGATITDPDGKLLSSTDTYG